MTKSHKWAKEIKSYFTLELVDKNYFTDVVSGTSVKLYVDCYGRYFMKDYRWGLFKVEKQND